MKEWMETRLDHLDLLVIQIDGVHMAEDTLPAPESAQATSRSARGAR